MERMKDQAISAGITLLIASVMSYVCLYGAINFAVKCLGASSVRSMVIDASLTASFAAGEFLVLALMPLFAIRAVMQKSSARPKTENQP